MFCFLVASATVAISTHVTQWFVHCNSLANHRIRCSAVEKCVLFLIPLAQGADTEIELGPVQSRFDFSKRNLIFSSPRPDRPRRHSAPYTMCTRKRGREAKHSRPSNTDVKKVRQHNSFSQKLSCRVLNETRGQLHIHRTIIRFLPNLFLTSSHN